MKLNRIINRLTATILLMIILITSCIVAGADDNVTLAEQTFILTPEQGVTVTLKGLMPYKGYADAKVIENDDALYTYDLTIHYPSGTEFEPAKDSSIDVSFKSKAIAKAIKDKDTTLEAVHIEDNGKEETVIIDSAKKDKVCFEAESFSIYMIKTHEGNDENLNPRRTYHFLSSQFTQLSDRGEVHYKAPEYLFLNKLNMQVSTQTIRSGEQLEEVIMPENDNSGLFYGWYEVEFEEMTEDGQYQYNWGHSTLRHVKFLEPIEFPDATEDEDIYLAPLFGRYRFLTFHQDIKGSPNADTIVARKLIALNNDRQCEMTISDIRAPSSDPNRIIFWGWEFTHGEGCPHVGEKEVHQTVNADDSEIPTTITIEDQEIINHVQPDDEEMRHKIYDVYPVFREARWIEFDVGSVGDRYVAPQFIMLDDDTTSFNNVPTAVGYEFEGWYYNVDNGDGTYTQQMVTDENADILTGVNEQLATGMKIQDGKLVLDRTASEQIFRAKWRPAATADIHVVVWKQKISDDKYASTYNKTYDFYHYYSLSDLPTTQFATDTDEYRNSGYEDLVSSNPDDFMGFHFARTSASDNGGGNMEKEYDPNTMTGDRKNWKVVDMKVNPNGSTIINIYYDRDLMTVTYHYNNYSIPENETAAQYTYTKTTATTGTLYGLIDNKYTLITNEAVTKPYYTFDYKYTSTTSTSTSTQYYGISDNNEYVPLTRELLSTTYTYTQTDRRSVYTLSTSTSNGNYYIISNGAFTSVYLYYNNGTWYKNRSGSLWSGYTYSNPYTGDRFTKNTVTYSGNYTGQRYKIVNDVLTATDDETGTLYARNGSSYYQITSASNTQYGYVYNNEVYTGTRYTRADDGSTRYYNHLYNKTGDGFEIASDDTGAIYGLNNGIYQKLTKKTETVNEWSVQSTGVAYEGDRYTRSNAEANIVIWTGLYGQTYAKYGYIWPTSYKWNEQSNGNGTGQTLLTGFTTTEGDTVITDYHLYCQGSSTTYKIYHCRQKLDGTYSQDPEFCDEASISTSSSSGSVTFYFSNKYDGFIVNTYSSSFNSSGTGETCRESASIRSGYYIYHRRTDDHEFVFNENYNSVTHTVSNVKFEQPLDSMEAQAPTVTRENYTFSGWYEDETCTQEFDFEHSIMPNGNKIVYAKWTPVKYRVSVDPDGGEMSIGGTSSTYFNIDYNELVGEYANIRRNYVPSDNGTYVYANFSWEKVKNFPGVTKLDAVYRKAFYININDINNTYYHPFTVDGENYSYSQTGMTLDEFKSCIDMETLYSHVSESTLHYRLVSWHKVKPDGTMETTPFNFKNPLSGDITLRARWVQQGGYSISYDPTMVSLGISGKMARYTDPYIGNEDYSARKYADKAEVVVLQEPTDLYTTGAGGHEIEDIHDFTFRGWQIVDGQTGAALEPGVYYDPGDTMILDAKHADSQDIIHMQAVYEKRASSGRRTSVASLTLHANAGDKGIVNQLGLAGDGSEVVNLTNKTIKLDRRNNNFSVNLKKYRKNFNHVDGHYLIGWSTTPNPGTYIPEYYADAVIGVNKQNSPNVLYAVWEPMVYLSLDNQTSSSVTFNLSLDTDKEVYLGHTNEITGELERSVFSEDTVRVTDHSTGSFTVTLSAGDKVNLVIPEGAGVTYTVSGDFNGSTNKNFMLYNSGSDFATTIERRNSRWYVNGSNSATTINQNNPYHYSTSGQLEKGPTGRQVIFTESNPISTLTLKTRFYDVENESWVDGHITNSNNPEGMNANAAFTGASQTLSDDQISAEVHLFNNNATTKFGLNVAAYDDDKYKFIGWYTKDEAAPYDYSVDGKSDTFGESTLTGLTVPPEDTTYYALFVPYIKGSLSFVHSEKDDTAGHCATGDGLKIDITYTSNRKSGQTFSATGDRDNPATITLDESIIDEKNTAGWLHVMVSAKPHEGSVYSKTQRNQVEVENVVRNETGYSYAEFEAPVSERFADSGEVKGLKELRTIVYSSSFKGGYTITYKYRGRDNQIKTLVLKGLADDIGDFSEYVISHTPYERSLAGDIIWDTQNISIKEDEYGKTAVLEENYTILEKCAVHIVTETGYEPLELVEYGETFSEKQANDHIAPETNSAGEKFDHWEIINFDTKKFIANCYSRRFTFKVWNHYKITPVYKAEPIPMNMEEANITIDYIDSSRNSWGEIIEDETGIDDTGIQDYVVCDLDLTFIDGNIKINTDTHRNNYDLGVIYEICGSIDSGGGVLNTDAYTSSFNTDDMEKRVNAVLTQPNATGSVGKGAVSGCTTPLNLYYAKVDNNQLSSFNRIQLARTFSKNNVKGRVFRVYAYMKTSSGIVLSEPMYITMHDYAAKKYEIGIVRPDEGRIV